MCFKLSKLYLNICRDLYLWFLHIPTDNSSYSVKEGDQFEFPIKDIEKLSTEGDILISGDFNARTGSVVDFVANDNDFVKSCFDQQYIVDSLNKPRNSLDTVRCGRGKNLLELCIQVGLRILNGRVFGDTLGKYPTMNILWRGNNLLAPF